MDDSQAVPLPITVEDSPSRQRIWLSVWCIFAAFGTYFCMYGFRKPFTASAYDELTFGSVGFKTLLVTAQVLGYMLSKFLGIKIIAEMRPERRAISILWLIGFSWLSLVLFGFLPPPYNLIAIFLNGLPLGMVFGLVLGFLEGRRLTEAFTAGLCTSFILADGVAKSVGTTLLFWGFSESWMPALAGLLFAPGLLLSVWMLSQIPPPSQNDIEARSERLPMSAGDRKQFFLRYAPGLTLLVLAYLLVTILRSVRADFAPEIWRGLGISAQPEDFTFSEIWVALGVMLLNGSAVLLINNRLAFASSILLSLGGLLLIILTLVALSAAMISPFYFMVLVGLGLYIPYVAVHTTLFERLIAMTRDRGNIGYLMYLADAFGYLGYVAVMFFRNFLTIEGDLISFFQLTSWVVAILGVLAFAFCGVYFLAHPATVGQSLRRSG